jgi:hypothetical protein
VKTNKELANELFQKHIALAYTDGRLFRKTVMEEMKAITGCSQAAAATFYNQSKKAAAPIEGLGRVTVAKGVRKMGGKGKSHSELIPDNECFTVLELIPDNENFTVGRCQSFLMQGDASEKFDDKVGVWPNNHWVLVQGLGPVSGDTFKLDQGEKEIKRYSPKVEEETV